MHSNKKENSKFMEVRTNDREDWSIFEIEMERNGTESLVICL